MKSYQLKTILKKSKPPVWKRCIIPAGITFSQLALILEEMVEAELSPDYEYEFYQSEVHVREWREGKSQLTSYFYDYMCASDTYINKLADKDVWFTFRPGDGSQYRVEIEMRMKEKVSYPVVIKQRSCAEIREWMDINAMNERLRQHYTINYGEPDYRNFEELRSDRESGKYGLTGAKKPVDRLGRWEKSANSNMAEFSKNIQKLFAEKEKKMKMGDTRNPSIQEFLLGETSESLLEMAEDLGVSSYKSLNKDRLAGKIRDEILKPEVMARRMLLLSDDEIQEFERAVARGKEFYPSREEMNNLERSYFLTYIMFYNDDYAEVPREVAEVYKKINTPEYQEKRRGTYWMYHCLMMAEMLYGCAAVDAVCQMLGNCLGHKVEREEFEKLFAEVPKELKTCVLLGDRVIDRELLEDKLYLRLEKEQEGKAFYLPSPDEIIEYTEQGYPVSDPHYRKLKRFLVREMKVDNEKAEEYMTIIRMQISTGACFSDIMDLFEETGIEFESDETIGKFASLMSDVNNNTRMVIHRGHTPCEVMKMPPAAGEKRPKRPTLVPVSSTAAEILGGAADELSGMGFDLDLDFNADEITTVSMPNGISGKAVVGKKKVYPNDPCPCGSGKKYKKCCGRRM